MAAELVESYEYKDGYLIRKVKTRDDAFVSSMLPSNVAYNNITPEDYDLCWLKMKSKPVLNNPSKEMKLVDLFSSTGPMTLGLVEADRALGIKISPSFAIDFEKNAAANYKLNFPECIVANDDINNILDGDLGTVPSALEKRTIKKLGDIDIVIAGLCTFSYATYNLRK